MFGRRPCVRARAEAVETPLNKTKKSRNARMKPFFSLLAIGDEPRIRKSVSQLLNPIFDGLGARTVAGIRCNRIRYLLRRKKRSEISG